MHMPGRATTVLSVQCLSGIACCLLLVTGCATARPARSEWLGKSRATVIDALGAPAAARPDGRGGTVLEYDDHVRTIAPRAVGSDNRLDEPGRGIAPVYYSHKRMIYVDPQGIVYDVRDSESVR